MKNPVDSFTSQNQQQPDIIPITVSTIEYDFENYAINYGIPETLDPLPYRKAGSVFATTGDEAGEPILTSAKHDPRLRTVVCRHWLRDLCMKGAACEFLHQYDLNKMPLCRHGERCKIRDCPFRHISEENRMECAFYKSGFCIHGPFCRYKHAKRPREDLPTVADFTLGLSQMQAGKEAVGGPTSKRPAPKPNEFYKISLCKHFAAGDCPFGEGCHFAHGEHELRTFPRKNEYGEDENGSDAGDGTNGGGGGEGLEHQHQQQQHVVESTTMMDYFQGGGVTGGGKPCPIIDYEQASFFIIMAATQEDLAISTVRGEWYIQRNDADQINSLFLDATSGTKRLVMLFFTVSNSNHIQGAALVTKAATYNEYADQIQQQQQNQQNQKDKKQQQTDTFCYKIGIEWYRTTEFPIKTAKRIIKTTNYNTSTDTTSSSSITELVLPTTDKCCVQIPAQHGNTIMKALWNLPVLPLYESWGGNDYYYYDENTNEEIHDIPELEYLLTDFRASGGIRTIFDDDGNPIPTTDEYYDTINNNDITSRIRLSWPTMPGPGFIFGCSSDTMDECLGRGIFGLPNHMKSIAMQTIVPGSTIFLFNVTDRLLFGIFEALCIPTMNIVPTAFSKNPKATTSPFPVQVRVRVSLECPPLEDTDPILNDILRTRNIGLNSNNNTTTGQRIGPLSHAQTVAIATLLANQCGALSYMQEYQTAILQKQLLGDSTIEARPPPIALPPRKIVVPPTPTKQQEQEQANDEKRNEEMDYKIEESNE